MKSAHSFSKSYFRSVIGIEQIKEINKSVSYKIPANQCDYAHEIIYRWHEKLTTLHRKRILLTIVRAHTTNFMPIRYHSQQCIAKHKWTHKWLPQPFEYI